MRGRDWAVVLFCLWFFGQWLWFTLEYLYEVHLERKRKRCP